MTVFLFFVGLFQCALLYFLGKTGQRLEDRAARDMKLAGQNPREGWPKLALIIPVAGQRPHMEEALKSLLCQDYPDFVPIVVTATAEDSAMELIRALKAEDPRLQHIVAGGADACGQKNRNLLAGVAACGEFPAAYVFCDSTHIARPDFLRCLVGPIARGEAAICTGYHIVIPRDNTTITLAYAQSVLLMRFLQGMSAFTQPWGGALAISRQAFARYDIAELWKTNVVDDCSLGAFLQKEGAHIELCPGAILETRAMSHSLPIWRAWLERQVLFLKFCMPGQWLALGLLALLMAIPPIWCASACLEGMIGDTTGTAPFLALCWLCLIAWTMTRWRAFLPSPPPPGRWLWAFFCASLMFLVVFAGTLASRSIVWQNCVYRVGRGGKVISIQRH